MKKYVCKRANGETIELFEPIAPKATLVSHDADNCLICATYGKYEDVEDTEKWMRAHLKEHIRLEFSCSGGSFDVQVS